VLELPTAPTMDNHQFAGSKALAEACK